MTPLTELCDVVAEEGEGLAGKIAVVRSQCPQPEALDRGLRLSVGHLNGVLAFARFLACPQAELHHKDSLPLILCFLEAVPSYWRETAWPASLSSDDVLAFFSELLDNLLKIERCFPAASEEISSALSDTVRRIVAWAGGDRHIFVGANQAVGGKGLLTALAQRCPHLRPSDAELLVACLLDNWILSGHSGSGPSSSGSSAQTSPSPVSKRGGSRSTAGVVGTRSPLKVKASVEGLEQRNHIEGTPAWVSNEIFEGPSPKFTFDSPISVDGVVTNGLPDVFSEGGAATPKSVRANGTPRRQSVEQLALSLSIRDTATDATPSLEEESLESLERRQTAFRLLAQLLEQSQPDTHHWRDLQLRQLRNAAAKQLKLVIPLLKIRRRDWPGDGVALKMKMNLKLQACQAASAVLVKCDLFSNPDPKLRSPLRETLSLLLDAADACIGSLWRKLSQCEQLFDKLLGGVAEVAAADSTQVSRILLRIKTLALATCAQADTWETSQGQVFGSVVRTSCKLIDCGWKSDRASIESFLLSLAAYIREVAEQDEREKLMVAVMQLNVIPLLAELVTMVNRAEAVDMMLPLLLESLEEGDASAPSKLRLRLLEAVARMASLGWEKSYKDVVGLLVRSYFQKLNTVGSTHSRTLAPEGTTERVETLPSAFQQIARDLRDPRFRLDYRQRLLQLCSDVGLVAEARVGRSGADLLGPLLPAVAEVCSDITTFADVDSRTLKWFRNLWFYIVLFGLAPPIQKVKPSTKAIGISRSTQGSQGSASAMTVQSVSGPYPWSPQWAAAVQRIAEGTPPLVVSSVMWLEDEIELSALHNPGSRRGSNNEKAATAQRAALSAALGGRVDAASLGTVSGVKSTYLLAVAFLEILRFSRLGGVIRRQSPGEGHQSALSCMFQYLESPDLLPAVYQCLIAITHQAFDSALIWLGEKVVVTGKDAEERELILATHACFLIKNLVHPKEIIRDLSDSLLGQLRSKFPQLLWTPFCLDALMHVMAGQSPHSTAIDAGYPAARRLLIQRVRDWVISALCLAPCTTQGLLQEQFRRFSTWDKVSHTGDLVSLLSDIKLIPAKSGTSGTTTVTIPAVVAAAAAAAGANPRVAELGNLEVLSTGIVSANVKSNYSGEIAGMKRLYVGIGGLEGQVGDKSTGLLQANGIVNYQSPSSAASSKQNEKVALDRLLVGRFLQLLQQFVTDARRRSNVDTSAFREVCLRATALLLSDIDATEKKIAEGVSQLLRLLCWCPVHIFLPGALETGIFVWTWILSAAPHLRSFLLAELVDAWLWTVDSNLGLFASGVNCSGPAAKLRPQLKPGELEDIKDVVSGITVHRLWLGFFLDRFEVVKYSCSNQLLLIGRLIEGSIKSPERLCTHPAAAGGIFTLMLFGLKYCAFQLEMNTHVGATGFGLLEDRVYRAALQWYCVEPGWSESDVEGMAQTEAQAVSLFVQNLSERLDSQSRNDMSSKPSRATEQGQLALLVPSSQLDHKHPVWGSSEMDNAGRERRKQLLLMLCQHEADRLDTWAFPLKESTVSRVKHSSERWIEYLRTAWSVDPSIALSLVARFPAVSALRTEMSFLVQANIPDLVDLPAALPYFVSPKAVEEDSPLLQWLPHWAPCSITHALEFLTPPFKGHPRVMAYVLRVMESYPPESVTFFMPQLVQSLRYDAMGLVEGYLMVAAQKSNLFAHRLIWQLQGEEPPTVEEPGKDASAGKGNALYEIVPKVRARVIESFSPEAHDVFVREFRFFDRVTSISGILYPLPKEERRAGIRKELEKIEVDGDDLYLPTAPSKLVRGIEVGSGIPLQSAAKVPIMITFDVVDKGGDPDDIKLQACIFKVGDDCRQDVLALQVISLLRDIFQAVGVKLYLFPYGVLPTGYGRGIIEVVPNTRSRNQMGEITDGGLYELFQQDYGPVGSPRFEAARENFIVSSAGYAVASLLLQPKDRHNGNLLFDNDGRLVHIDFGFILETSPGGNLRFENAHFKLSHEMTQLLDPSGVMRSETWNLFVRLCVKGYLAARQHMDGIINTVLLMVDSGLPCFSRGDPIGNLRKRFHPEMSEREAANFMIKTCADAYNKWSTAGYDLIQYLQQGIEK